MAVLTVDKKHFSNQSLDGMSIPKPLRDSKGLNFREDLTLVGVAADCVDGVHISRRAKSATVDMEKAGAIVEDAIKLFAQTHSRLMDQQDRISAGAKQASTNVRKAANEIAEGVQRLERIANFDALERKVAVLERAAAALKIMAELERDGHVSRILGAMK